jgi:hypothetical protein
MKYWEAIADNHHRKSPQTLDGIAALWRLPMAKGARPIWVVAAERDDAGRFIVRGDEKLAAFMELEAAIRSVPLRQLFTHGSCRSSK